MQVTPVLAARTIGRRSSIVRSRAFADSGELETLLHGDLWTSNVVVTRTIRGLEPKLLDWDRLGPGPASYDLSAFLLRFPRERRLGIMELIDRAIVSGREWVKV